MIKKAFWLSGLYLFAETTQASDVGESSLNIYKSLLKAIGVREDLASVVAALLTLVACLTLGIYFRGAVKARLQANNIAPDSRFSLLTAIELVISFLHDLTHEQCGKFYKSYLPLISGLFVFILVSNLIGLFPGFPPPTENFSSNLVMGIIVFLSYNWAGLKEHGGDYIKQFTGPFLVLAPLFLILETISHLARPLSLSFRLTANIFGDHLLLGIFSGLVPFLVPSFLLFFGLLVAVIQSFVFTMLTSIYINMAVSHDH